MYKYWYCETECSLQFISLISLTEGVNIPDIDEEYPDITVYDLWDPDKIQDEKVRANFGPNSRL